MRLTETFVLTLGFGCFDVPGISVRSLPGDGDGRQVIKGCRSTRKVPGIQLKKRKMPRNEESVQPCRSFHTLVR